MKTTPRAALITGATSGIGNAFAHALPASTALLLTGRDADALRRSAADLGRGRVVQTVHADLSQDAGLDAVSSTAERMQIDLLICNAGLGRYGDLLDAEESGLRATVSVNVMAPLVLMRRLLPGMIKRAEQDKARAGLIVVSSTAGFLPVPRLAAYAASKAFDLSLAEAVAAELTGRPIDVLALCPTATRSNLARRSGFGPMPSLAQPAGYVVRRALWALGRQPTLVLGPVSGPVLGLPATVRGVVAQALQMLLPR